MNILEVAKHSLSDISDTDQKLCIDNDFIIIEISAKIYAGFQYKISKNTLKNMKTSDIIDKVKIYMINFFKTHNLYLLQEGVDNMKLHFHTDILFNKNIVYLCDHCHEQS